MIIKLTITDVNLYQESLKILISLCFDSSYKGRIDIAEKINSMEKHILDGSACVVGDIENNELVGFLWGYPLNSVEGNVFHVAYISVCEQWQGKGIARRMLAFAEREASNLKINFLELMVSNTNIPALSLYQSVGFVEVRKILKKEIVGE